MILNESNGMIVNSCQTQKFFFYKTKGRVKIFIHSQSFIIKLYPFFMPPLSFINSEDEKVVLISRELLITSKVRGVG